MQAINIWTTSEEIDTPFPEQKRFCGDFYFITPGHAANRQDQSNQKFCSRGGANPGNPFRQESKDDVCGQDQSPLRDTEGWEMKGSAGKDWPQRHDDLSVSPMCMCLPVIPVLQRQKRDPWGKVATETAQVGKLYV